MAHPGIPRVLTNPAAEFVETRVGPETSVAFGGPKKYDSGLDKFVDPDTPITNNYDASDNRLKLFRETLARFQKTCQEKGITFVPKPGQAVTINDVLETVGNVETKHKNCATTSESLGKIKRFFRAASARAESATPWIKCIPQDMYGAPLYGAFEAIITAASRAHDLREKMYLALAEIPSRLNRIREYNQLYKSDRLHQLASHVYVAIFVALETIMAQLLKSSFRKAGAALIAGKNYGERVDKALETLTGCVDDFNEEVTFCTNHRLGEVASGTKEIVSVTTKTLLQTTEIKDSILEQDDRLVEIQASTVTMNRGIDKALVTLVDVQSGMQSVTGYALDTHKSIQSLGKRVDELVAQRGDQGCHNKQDILQRRRSTHASNSIYQLFASSQYFNPRTGGLSDEAQTWAPVRAKFPGNWCKQFQNDVATCMDTRADLTGKDLDRISFIMDSPAVRDWLSGTSLKLLHIRPESFSTDRVGPISYSTAFLSYCLQSFGERGRESQYLVIGYFCSLHTGSDQTTSADGAGMLRSLIRQLLHLVSGSGDKSSMALARSLLGKDGDFQLLLRYFKSLIESLPPTQAVFCLLDGVAWYETTQKTKEMHQVLEAILAVVGSRPPVFKILLTECQDFRIPARLVSSSEELYVPDWVDGFRDGISDLSLLDEVEDEIQKFRLLNLENSRSTPSMWIDETFYEGVAEPDSYD